MGKPAGWAPSADQRLCSDHFEAACYEGKSAGKMARLNAGAVPTIFNAASPKRKRGRPKGSKNLRPAVAAGFRVPAGSRRSSTRVSRPSLKTLETSKLAYDSEDETNLPVKKRRLKEEVRTDDDKPPPVPDVDDSEVNQLLEEVVEPTDDDGPDGDEGADDGEQDEGKRLVAEAKGDQPEKEPNLNELLDLAKEKLREARVRSGAQRKRIIQLERTLKRKKVVNKQLRSKVVNLQDFIKRNRPRLYEPPIRRYWRDRPRMVRGTQTRQSEFFAIMEGGEPQFSDDNVADYEVADVKAKQDPDSRRVKKRRKKRVATANAATGSETETDAGAPPTPKKKRARKTPEEIATATIIPTKYTKELPKPAPKRMPGIKPAPSASAASALSSAMRDHSAIGSTIIVKEDPIGGGGGGDDDDEETHTTTLILPDDHEIVEEEDDETSLTTTVVIEETPEGTIIQQQPTTTVKHVDVSAALAHMQPVQVIETSGQREQQQQRAFPVQIQSGGQSVTGIPVKIVQDATTIDGQKISIIKIQSPEDGVAVQHPQQVYVRAAGGQPQQQMDPNSVVVSEVILTAAENEMPSAEELLKTMS